MVHLISIGLANHMLHMQKLGQLKIIQELEKPIIQTTYRLDIFKLMKILNQSLLLPVLRFVKLLLLIILQALHHIFPVSYTHLLFHFHENPNSQCPVGRNIHNILDGKLVQIQNALENELKKITLADVINDTKYYISKDNK